MTKADTAPLTDSVLCFCDGITYESFRRAHTLGPDMSFDELCRQTGVGLKCTSCLLNAETEFVDTAATLGPADGTAAPRRKRQWRLSKQAIYGAIDRLSTKTPFVRQSIMPIIKGRGARTLVSMSNAVPADIGADAPAFRVSAQVRDCAGRLVFAEDETVPAGGRYELEADRHLPNVEDDAFVTGSCRLEFAACESGYFGAVRPHLAVTTPLSMAAVHGAGRGKTVAYHRTAWCNRAETQYVSVINCSSKSGRVSVSQTVGGAVLDETTETMPGSGALLIPLRDVGSKSGAGHRLSSVRATSEVEARFNFVVSCGDPPRIALDHL